MKDVPPNPSPPNDLEKSRQSQRMELLGRLAGGVAHDFNNLLTAILGFAELISFKLRTDDPIQKDLDQIRAAGEKAVSLTRQLLAFGRRQHVQKEILCVNMVVGELEKILRRFVGENISLLSELSSDLGWVSIDRGQLDQVVLNLVFNAKESMPAGGRIFLKTLNAEVGEALASEQQVNPGPYVLFQVTDTGARTDEDFRRLPCRPDVLSPDTDPWGLGLASMFVTVRQNGGFVEAASCGETGMAYRVYIPRVPHPAEVKAGLVDLPPAPAGGFTILLVEDDGSVRALVKDLLRAMAYRVLEADNGDAALVLEKQFKEPIHLLLTDVIMPGISGAELARTFQEIRPDARVLFMSGYAHEAIGGEGVLEPGLQFIQKPFSPRELLEKVRHVLSDA